ncbi:MAG: hypothetical protein A2566_00935 [Candidatus Zambryskibacteria bacterium RIFOXYD1_FULL_40_13]|nr:MAG: hypothetical protein UT25_C0001G0176 [Parcubacteria group bacterium GW2011_GWC1_39_12]KKR19700.1 MAG: hypothetical protein UT49_C0001G0176 [Parcubacteria group bacterium GW2011_GWF1_39_37]KKR35856.1 MAG: hypothetical protein UT68_C0001G0179 [Parcubacteria group bacterium GW2011_GWC2_40_10]KKR52668.1 MAG: hypothetical protein UT89_C0001G0176 [Parcubacteria group bacterium GW2011_GWE1_40_20]KKR66514.1 MAG: hypothetical protein UU06_C0001G0047 [Parcubacteria group bacterium GW2011_GWB1_40_
MNYILFSKNELFREGAEKIKIEAQKQNKQCEVLEIHSITKNGILRQKIDNTSLVYFLTNDVCIPEYIELLKKKGAYIVNEAPLSGDLKKYILQNKVKNNGVRVPKNICLSSDKETGRLNLKYPVYIKSQKQGSLVIYNLNPDELNKNIISIGNINEFYFEEAVEIKGFVLRKFYYIKEVIIDMDKKNTDPVPDWLYIVLKNISLSLKLEVFSSDIFVNWSSQEYFCIDINPASSFFKSEKARKEFVRNILI